MFISSKRRNFDEFSGKMWLMIILEITKTGLYLLSRKYIIAKTTGDPPPSLSVFLG